MTPRGRSPLSIIDLESLGFDRGAHLLVDHALAPLPAGARLEVTGADPHLPVHLRAWARARGHRVDGSVIIKGSAAADRWRHAERAGGTGVDGVAATASPQWGLAARGALVEAGGPPLDVSDLVERDEVWADIAPKLYAQAVASQWDPATIAWDA